MDVEDLALDLRDEAPVLNVDEAEALDKLLCD